MFEGNTNSYENIDMDFNKQVKKLVDKKQFFVNIHPSHSAPTRILNINRHYFRNDDSLCEYRANYSYYSYKFEKLLKENNIDTTNEISVYQFFMKEKNNLPDLGCILDGYF